MSILAVTPYTGSEKLVKMTERMLKTFGEITFSTNEQIRIVAVNNAASRPIKIGLCQWHCHMDSNVGFGNAINFAILREIIEPPKLKIVDNEGKSKPFVQRMDITHVLVLNNDLEFPDPNWLSVLLAQRDGDLVLSPCTDITATAEARAEGARDLDPIRHAQVSAFCWLVPVSTIMKLRRKFGVSLFHPNWSNYGSDDVTAAMLRSIISKKPFKIVPRSFVRHLKAQTANELGVKAGTPELLRSIANFKRSHRLT